MANGTLAILGENSRFTSEALNSMIASYNIPYLTWSSINMKRKKGPNSLLNLKPDLGPAVVDLVESFEWNNIYFLFNHQNGIFNLESMSKKLLGKLNMRKINQINQVREILR